MTDLKTLPDSDNIDWTQRIVDFGVAVANGEHPPNVAKRLGFAPHVIARLVTDYGR